MQKMPFSLFLNSLPEPYLSFCSESLDYYHTLTYLCMCCVLFLLFYFLLKVPFTWTFWENEYTQKCQGRAKRRRKGGTQKGCRYYQREEEEKKLLVSILKSPLGQHHDTIHFRQLLCPDPSCEVCNNATTEINQLLFSEALEDAAPSVCSLASTAPVTEPSFTLSPAVSAVPPGDLIPPPLPEPFPPPPSILSPNPVTPLGDFPSLSPSVHCLPPELFPSLESEFTVESSPSRCLAFPSLPPHDTQSMETPLTLNTIFLSSSIIQDINSFPDLAQTLNPIASVTYYIPPTLSVSPPPDYSLTGTQPKSIHIPSKPALENSSPHSTGALSTYVLQGTDHPSLSISDFSCQEAHVKDPLPFTLAQCDFNQVKNVEYDSEKDLKSYMMSLSRANSMVSGKTVRQKQLANALKVHLSKKFEEINEGQLPATVHSSWHAIQQTLPAQSHTKIKQRILPPTVGGEYCLNTSQELSFLGSSAQQTESHITKFPMEMLWGLPAKVLESIEIFKLRDTSSHSLYDSKSSSSTTMISEVDSKSGGFMHRQGSSKTLNHPHPATSLVGQEEQGTLRLSPSDTPHWLAEEVQRILDAGQTLKPVTNSIIDKACHGQSPRAKNCPPKLPSREAGAGHKPKDQCVNSSQGKKTKNSETVSRPNVSRAEELDALQSKMSDVLTTSKPGISQRINVNESKGATTLRTGSLPAKCSVLQYPKSANRQKQLMAELKGVFEKRKQCLGQDRGTRVSQAAPPMLHVHFENRRLSMELPQEPWVSNNVSRLCQNRNFPLAVKKVSSTGSISEELGGRDAGLGTSQPLKERLGSKSSQTPSQKTQSPSESFLRNQMNHFFQWLHPGIKCKKQEYFQEESPIPSVKSRGPVKSRAAFIGKLLGEKLGRQHAVDITCPQEPLPSAVKLGKAQHKAAVWAGAEPVQGHPFNSRGPSCKVTNTNSYGQEAVFRDKERHPQKVVAFKDKLLCQKPPTSEPFRGTVLHPSRTCRPQAAQGPPAAGGLVEINLYYVDRNQFSTIFRGKINPTRK